MLKKVLAFSLLMLLFAWGAAFSQDISSEKTVPITSVSPDQSDSSGDSNLKEKGVGAKETSHQESQSHGEKGDGHGNLGRTLPVWSTLPFVGILLSIAFFPLFAPHFWHNHFPKVSAFWAFAFAIPFLAFYSDNAWLSVLGILLPVAPSILIFTVKEKQKKIGAMVALVISGVVCMSIMHAVGGSAWFEILHIYLLDYIPFIILLWALYTVAGGLVVTGTLRGSPIVNFSILLLGVLMASWIGTTGAAMFLIRPLIRANSWRKRKVHIIVFFIFLVANIGGALTPLGDPPLFLGFLHNVDFFWTFNLLPQMVFASVFLLGVFLFMDIYYYRKEGNPPDDGERKPIRVHGLYNFIFLGGIILSVLISGSADLGEKTILGVHQSLQNLLRDALLVTMGVLSLAITPTTLRKKNEFTWAPILEVAYLFAGIFMTIIPALAILKAGSQGALAVLVDNVSTPERYFWATGILSSFLDNAPTYLTFFNSALGKSYSHLYPLLDEKVVVPYLMAAPGEIVNGVAMAKDCASTTPCGGFKYLSAISAGAVFMGANTYIGNAPNFMVKSIAEEAGIPMPSFFGYIIKFSLPILIPLFVAVSFIFYS